MADGPDIESVERVIAATPEAIFSLLADPSRHHDIDGSGTVHDAKNTSRRVGLGDTFSMAMKKGVPYTTHNTVIEFEENRRIAWQPKALGLLAPLLGGPIWRYELELSNGGTRVHETWDFSTMRLMRRYVRRPASRADTRNAMAKTLDNIEKLLATP
jgi:hypothetical protein